MRSDVLTRMRHGRIVDVAFPRERLREVEREDSRSSCRSGALFENTDVTVGNLLR